jgi:hypothetical protein
MRTRSTRNKGCRLSHDSVTFVQKLYLVQYEAMIPFTHLRSIYIFVFSPWSAWFGTEDMLSAHMQKKTAEPHVTHKLLNAVIRTKLLFPITNLAPIHSSLALTSFEESSDAAISGVQDAPTYSPKGLAIPTDTCIAVMLAFGSA